MVLGKLNLIQVCLLTKKSLLKISKPFCFTSDSNLAVYMSHDLLLK